MSMAWTPSRPPTLMDIGSAPLLWPLTDTLRCRIKHQTRLRSEALNSFYNFVMPQPLFCDVTMQPAGNFATELKFALDTEGAAAVREWARTELVPDPHAADAEGDGYHTTSLYFDTEDLDVFFRRGSHGRAKYRIRRYNDG